MYIKQIIIDGFKSYKEKTVIEFDPKHNVIVGENGSGKSSLVLAIQFVLSRSLPLTENERPILLNRKNSIRSASVEIIFDNTDEKLPIDKKSVSVKRTVSIKTDQYFLDGEAVSADDISRLLETAGFLKSISQYIIKQGEIAELSLIPEKRLQLIQELAGTDFYTNYQENILKTIHAIDTTNQNIHEMLDRPDEKEDILKKDIEILTEYNNLHKQKQAIEFFIHEQIISENKDYLKMLENQANKSSKDQEDLLNKLQILQEDIKKIDTERKKFKKLNQKIQEEKNKLDSEKEKLMLENSRLIVEKAELKEDMKNTNENYKAIDKRLQEIESLINEKKKKLGSIQSQWAKKIDEEESIKIKLDSSEQEHKQLCRKKGRGTQFKNKEERDLWIKQELKQLENQIDDYKNNQLKVEKKIMDDNRKCDFLEKNIEIFKTEVINLEKKINDYRMEIQNLKTNNIAKLLTLRNTLFKENKNFTDKLDSLKNDTVKLERTLKSLFGKNIIDSKNSVEKVLEIFKDNENMASRLTEYHGLVIENFNCDSNIFKAVEETAGKQLFYHIVETSSFGKEILNEINSQRLPGEITFFPLDCLKLESIFYPAYDNAKPLISQLKYNIKYESIFRRIFGKTLVCSDLKVATTIAKESHFDCITLEGDKVSSKVFLRGGYFSYLHSPMNIENEIIDIKKNICLVNEKLNNIKEEIKRNDNDISICLNKQQNIEVIIEKTSKVISDKKSEINVMKKELYLIHASTITNKNTFKEYETQLNIALATQQNLKDEICQGMIEDLSIHDQQLIENLIDSITQLKKKFEKIINERNKLENEKNELEAELNEALNCQQEELVEMKKKIAKSLESIEESIILLNGELQIQESEIMKTKAFSEEHKIKAKNMHEQLKEVVSKRNKLLLDEEKLLNANDKISKEIEKVNTKIVELKKQIEDSCQKQSKLSKPSEYFWERFSKMNHKKLSKMLQRTITKLRVHDHSNKQVLDELNKHRRKKQQLHDKKNELSRTYHEFQHLIKVLEEKKDNNIQIIFNQISKHFTDIFKIFIPTGNAYLIMKTADDSNSQNVTETSNKSTGTNDFLRIDVMATFTNSTEAKEIQYLSEGQKSLLSIVFIFAVQKSHPTPVYLFDEIDKALDPIYKEAVVKMILQQNAQFITISFGSDFIQHANTFHRITFKNDTSHVQPITRNDAITFLNGRKST